MTKLYLDDNLLADVSAVEDFKRLKQLKELDLMINPDLITDEIVKLQKGCLSAKSSTTPHSEKSRGGFIRSVSVLQTFQLYDLTGY